MMPMKRILPIFLTLILTSCAASSGHRISDKQETYIIPPPPPVTTITSAAESTVPDVPDETTAETDISTDAAVSESDSIYIEELPDDPSESETHEPYDEIDIDLTPLDGNMVYAQVYDMMFNGDSYMDKVVKVNGVFGYYQDETTGEEFFGVVIKDATACCSQGIEFVLDGEHSYPDDYPPLGAEITVTGVFNYYTEGPGIYLQLLHADLEISEP